MSLASRIRVELEKAELHANFYYTPSKWSGYSYHEIYGHYMSRRKFFLGELLKVQIKEFNYD